MYLRPRPVRGRFVRDGSAPPALAALRASRRTTTTLTTQRASLVFRRCTMASSSCPYWSPASCSSVSSSRNAPLKVSVARPPRNCTRTLPRRRPPSRHCCRCRPPNLPAQCTARTSIAHQHRQGRRTPHRRRRTVTSVVLFLLRRLHRHRRGR
jgi:hypothetical protein